MTTKYLAYLFGIFAILISLSTWMMDFTGMVEACIYCRIERTVIGILGILMLLPLNYYLKIYLVAVLGFFGASIASDQIFVMINNKEIDHEFILAICALIIIVVQTLFIIMEEKIKK